MTPIVRAARTRRRGPLVLLTGVAVALVVVAAVSARSWAELAWHALEGLVVLALVAVLPGYLLLVRPAEQRLHRVATRGARLDGVVVKANTSPFDGDLIHVVHLDVGAPDGEAWSGSFSVPGTVIGHGPGEAMHLVCDLREGGLALFFSDRLGLCVGRVHRREPGDAGAR